MIKFKEINGLQLENTSNLQKIERTEEGRAIGHIDGWKMLVDPKYVDGVSVRNRAIAGSKFTSTRTGITKVDMFEITQPTRISSDNRTKINANEYTFFAVVDFTQKNDSFASCIIRGDSDRVENAPNFLANPSGTHIAVFKEVRQVTYDNLITGGNRIANFALRKKIKGEGLSLLMLSYSDEHGFSASQNGVSLGDSVIYKTKLDTDLNAFSLLRDCLGSVGYIGILDIDLHKQSNSVKKMQLYQFLMSKYAIKG